MPKSPLRLSSKIEIGTYFSFIVRLKSGGSYLNPSAPGTVVASALRDKLGNLAAQFRVQAYDSTRWQFDLLAATTATLKPGVLRGDILLTQGGVLQKIEGSEFEVEVQPTITPIGGAP